jgi:prolyl-tRNA synthetase
MRYSQMLIPTVKEVPADAEIPSHQLMIRAGLIRKVASGTYTYLPLGWRSLKKIIDIVREEINRAGAQEILVPCLQPRELWQQTGRDADYGETMCRLEDRHGRHRNLESRRREGVAGGGFVPDHAGEGVHQSDGGPIGLEQILARHQVGAHGGVL